MENSNDSLKVVRKLKCASRLERIMSIKVKKLESASKYNLSLDQNK